MMNKKMSWRGLCSLGVSLSVLPAPGWSQVVFDGTTRSAGAGAATGPAFVISEADGLVSGSALVHSFSEFSIDSGQGQSATFTGGDNINLLLNRVTGSEASTINGAITSELVNADFYFLNPNGVIFGPDATINVPGAFTVSTASRLTIDGENAFDVNGDIADSTLSIADPARLTFIFDNQPARITLESGANLDNFEDLTLVSSAINSESVINDAGDAVGASLGSLGGVLSIGTSDSEFSFDPASASFPSGEIRLKDASVAAGGEVGGGVRIIGGELVMDGGDLNLSSAAEDSQFTASGDIELTNGYRFDMQPLNASEEPGVTPGFVFAASSISINGESSVNTRTFDGTDGLPISLNAENIQLTGGSVIASNTFSAGRGGDININASGSVLMAGRGETSGSLIRAATAVPLTGGEQVFVPSGFGEGEGGVIRVSAGEIVMRDGALISSFAAETDAAVIGADIQTANAGDIFLNANRLSLAGSSVIATLAEESAGGNVNIRVGDFSAILGSTIQADAQGALPDNPGADIFINTGSLFLRNAGISANASGGNGGNITIITNRFIRDPATSISASSNPFISGDSSIDGLVNDDTDTDIAEAFSEKAAFPDVTQLLTRRCTAAELTDRSSFVVSGDRSRAAAPTSYQLANTGPGSPVGDFERVDDSYLIAGLNLLATCFY